MKTTTTDETTRVIAHGDGGKWRGTLAQFFKNNEDGIGETERATIRQAVADGACYSGGGGAAGLWDVEAEDPLVGQLLAALDEVLDGAEGYASEHGATDRYWKAGALERARVLLDTFPPT